MLREVPEIARLFGHDVRTAWVTLGVFAAHIAVAFLVQVAWTRQPQPWALATLVIASYSVGAILSHWLGQTIHETSHFLAFGNRNWDRCLALFANLPMVFPIAMTFHRYHLDHHRWLNTEARDTDLPHALEVEQVGNRPLRKFFWLFLYFFVYVVRGLTFVKRPNKLELVNLVLQVIATVILLRTLGGAALGYLMLSTVVGHSLHPVAAHFVHEHYTFRKGQETYSYYGPLNRVTFNVGYHIEHHDFMRIPGWRLPELHALVPHWYDSLVSHRSWTWVLLRFITDRTLGVGSRIVRSAPEHKVSRAKFTGTDRWGNLRRMRNAPLAFLLGAHRATGGATRFRLGPFSAFMATSPEAVHQVLVDPHGQYDRNTRQFEIIGMGLGRSLLTTSGDFWLKQRRRTQRAFHRNRLESLGQRMTEVLEQGLARLPAEEHEVDFTRLAFSLTFELVLQTMFSSESTETNEEVAKAIEDMTAWIDNAMMSFAFLPLWVPSPRNLNFRRSKRKIERLCENIINTRMARSASRASIGESTSPEPEDLLRLLMISCGAEEGEILDRKQLTTEVMTMILAGHDTVAHSLSWLVALMGQHPKVRAEVVGELDDVLQGAKPSISDLPRLPLLTRVIKETMRLYPAGWLIGRSAAVAHEVQGIVVHKKALTFVSPYVVHRNEQYWPDPERFDPDRFLPERESERPKHAYIPFGAGPHVCIGLSVAMIELQIATAMLLQRFHIETLGSLPSPNPRITLALKGGLPVRLRPRSVSAASRGGAPIVLLSESGYGAENGAPTKLQGEGERKGSGCPFHTSAAEALRARRV